MATIVQKIKSALSMKSTDNIDLNINGKPAMDSLNEIETKLMSIQKLSESLPGVPMDDKKEGNYDDGYGATDKGNNPETDPSQTGNSKAEDTKPTSDDDMEECTCEKCGSKYKAKKSKEADEPVKDDAGEKKETYNDTYVYGSSDTEDKKETVANINSMASAFASFVPGQKMSLAKPTKAELDEFKTKSFKKEQGEIFGKSSKSVTTNQKMTQWVIEQFVPKPVAPKK